MMGVTIASDATSAAPVAQAWRRGRRPSDRFHCISRLCTRGCNLCTKCNCGYCSSKCKEAAKKAPRSVSVCQHGREKHKCKDCGTGYCQHGRRKEVCKDCGTGYWLRPRAPEERVQGLRHGLLPPRAPEEPVQGLRYGREVPLV
jgi:hypothetical protein